MKLRLDRKGLSAMVAVIVLLTLVLVLGAIIAGTLSGAPRPVLPATAAINLTTPYGGNPRLGDNTLIIRHEYGQVIDDAWTSTAYLPDIGFTDPVWHVYWAEMKLLVNGQEVYPVLVSATVNKTAAVISWAGPYNASMMIYMGLDPRDFDVCADFGIGDQIVIELDEPLESSDLIQLVYVPRDLMLVEYLVQ